MVWWSSSQQCDQMLRLKFRQIFSHWKDSLSKLFPLVVSAGSPSVVSGVRCDATFAIVGQVGSGLTPATIAASTIHYFSKIICNGYQTFQTCLDIMKFNDLGVYFWHLLRHRTNQTKIGIKISKEQLDPCKFIVLHWVNHIWKVSSYFFSMTTKTAW